MVGKKPQIPNKTKDNKGKVMVSPWKRRRIAHVGIRSPMRKQEKREDLKKKARIPNEQFSQRSPSFQTRIGTRNLFGGGEERDRRRTLAGKVVAMDVPTADT